VALVFDEPPRGPSTHALVIGVGGYDHLRDGYGQGKLARASRYGDLGQLTSPPRSACAFARFLTTSVAEDWVAPLASVDLLISTAPEDADPCGGGGPYQRATREGIQIAFDEWWDRCDTNAGNVAIFYFCGHGMQATNQVLLASDFGATGNPWAQAFDFNKTRQAFMANRASIQVFFIDACREVTTSNVEVSDPNAPPLREPEARQAEYCAHDLTIQATSRTLKAYGKEREVSYFTAAVLQALKGGAAKKKGGAWRVHSDLISSRIGDLVRLAGGADQRPVITYTTPTPLLRLRNVPEVIFEFGCEPAQATAVADLAYSVLPHGARILRPDRRNGPWKLVLPAALYRLEATFADDPFLDAEDSVSVEPPITREMLRVRVQ
jgi:hypothetical protein